jgi:hypothetical protein
MQAGQSTDQILVEAKVSAPAQTDPGIHPASYTVGTASFPGAEQLSCGIDHSPHLALRLKEEYSYISTPPLGLRSLF